MTTRRLPALPAWLAAPLPAAVALGIAFLLALVAGSLLYPRGAGGAGGLGGLGAADFMISTDFMEVGSLIGLAAVTGGELVIEDAAPRFLRMTRIAFGRLGIHWETLGETIRVPAGQELKG